MAKKKNKPENKAVVEQKEKQLDQPLVVEEKKEPEKVEPFKAPELAEWKKTLDETQAPELEKKGFLSRFFHRKK